MAAKDKEMDENNNTTTDPNYKIKVDKIRDKVEARVLRADLGIYNDNALMPDQAKMLIITGHLHKDVNLTRLFPDACCIPGVNGHIAASLKPYMPGINKVIVCQRNNPDGEKLVKDIHQAMGDKVHRLIWGPDDPPGIDINDLMQAGQDNRVRAMIEGAVCSPDVFRPKTITANFDPSRIPARQWIVYGSVLKGHVSVYIGPGGVCKSVYTLVMCILIAAWGNKSETDLTGPVKQYAKTLVINNEDDQDELERRIAGVLMLYDIQPEELKDRFLYESGYGARRLICEESVSGAVIRAPFVDRLTGYINKNKIELLVIDPLVSTHKSNENDNSKVDDIVQIYKSIAADTGCAIVLVHHTRKSSGDETPTIEASRGGKALSDGCRAGEIILPIPQSDKKLFGLSDDEARDIVRIDSGKSNYSKKGAGVYFRLESVKLQNGDWVGIPRRITLEKKVKDNGEKGLEIAQFMAVALSEKIGNTGGFLPWSELRANYMRHAKVKSTIANQEVTLLPKGKDKAQKVSFYDDDGQYVFCRIWYEKDGWRTAPIVIHMDCK